MSSAMGELSDRVEHRGPAIHENELAGDVPCGVRCKEDGGASNILRLPKTLEAGHARDECRSLWILIEGLGKIGLNDARRDRVHADVLVPPFDREIAGKL